MPDSKLNQPRANIPQTALDAALSDQCGALLRRALWLEALDQRLRTLLPATAATHCRLANVTSEQLIFVADSPTWRAKLRLIETQLIDAARSIGLTVTQVTIKTARVPAYLQPDDPNPPTTSSMSASTRNALQKALSSLCEIHPDSLRAVPSGSSSPEKSVQAFKRGGES
ncbi:MAG: DUF721 domain-containing protein [Xanthomonadaceae bacterium]|jgi:hypothetical protein|nr:DUF721 domain-containing protein [Xanthomonadaceae bacterium]